ncbi:NAD/NADP octopine/nopaline dehydrogenase family protein [Ancylomarina sp.]|uniref:NAD/NADP octopine/nopaline dehydrogenase family protein n=1 Tax=Ancylomarina sp. TaxID=1970196 RepID=UPI00356AC601
MVIGICGGGNIAHSLIGLLGADTSNEVRLLTRKPSEWQKQVRVINCEGSDLLGEISLVSDDASQIIPECELIILALPSQARESLIKQIAPFVSEGTWIGSFPGMGNFELICHKHLPLKEKNIRVFASQRVPCIARVSEYGKEVVMTSKKDSMAVVTLNPAYAEEISNLLSSLLDMQILPLNNFLEVTLSTSNPILHPARMYALFKDMKADEVWDKNPTFYESWNLESSEILIKMDEEVHNLLEKIPFDLSGIKPLLEHYDSTNAKELTKKLTSIQAFKGLLSPMKKIDEGFVIDLESRYFIEDISYGLILIKDIAHLFSINTPTIDQVIYWAQELLNKDYLLDGKLEGADCEELLLHLSFSISSPEEFLNFYQQS